MSHEDIEATKAPLMDHLIELRSRLIKALLAFGVMFGICFVFAKDIYNILVWPFVWVAGPENSKFIYTALLEYFITQLKLAMFGAAFLSFPIVATQIYMFVAPGLYRHERKAFLPYDFLRAWCGGCLFPGAADAGALLAWHAADRQHDRCLDRVDAESR
jgi:sec-independent protein translocase protein TatC